MGVAMDMNDILNENHSLDIPDEVFDNELKAFVDKLKSKPGFNPDLKFDASKHIKFTGPGKKHSFQDLGITKTHVNPISDIAAVEPFQLFTQEAVDMMKYEIFSNTKLIKKYGRLNSANNSRKASSLDFQVSGFIDDTVFTKAAWSCPEIKEAINSIMGDKLTVPHRFHMSHLNVSLAKLGVPEHDESIDYVKLKEEQDKNDDFETGVSWHYDSPPLVCVCMLSANEKMIGGETGMRIGDDSILRVPGPKEGYAALLQGRVIKHIATKPVNNFDRISAVTAFIPEDPMREDTTCATSERPSVSSAFTNDRWYPSFLDYRFDRIQKKLQVYRDELNENYKKGAKFDQQKAVDFMQGIEKYLQVTYQDFECLGEKEYPPAFFKKPYSEL